MTLNFFFIIEQALERKRSLIRGPRHVTGNPVKDDKGFLGYTGKCLTWIFGTKIPIGTEIPIYTKLGSLTSMKTVIA